MALERTTTTLVLTSVKIDTVFAYVRKRRGPFAVARLVSSGNLRSTDPSKLGTESWKRIVDALPMVLSPAELNELRDVVDLGA